MQEKPGEATITASQLAIFSTILLDAMGATVEQRDKAKAALDRYVKECNMAAQPANPAKDAEPPMDDGGDGEPQAELMEVSDAGEENAPQAVSAPLQTERPAIAQAASPASATQGPQPPKNRQMARKSAEGTRNNPARNRSGDEGPSKRNKVVTEGQNQTWTATVNSGSASIRLPENTATRMGLPHQVSTTTTAILAPASTSDATQFGRKPPTAPKDGKITSFRNGTGMAVSIVKYADGIISVVGFDTEVPGPLQGTIVNNWNSPGGTLAGMELAPVGMVKGVGTEQNVLGNRRSLVNFEAGKIAAVIIGDDQSNFLLLPDTQEGADLVYDAFQRESAVLR